MTTTLKVISILLLSVVSSNAMAEWVAVDAISNDKYEITSTEYVESNSIRKNADKVKVWVLFDYKKPEIANGLSYRSTKSQWEVDCKEEQYSTLYIIAYAKNMGDGEILYNNNVSEKPSPVVPDSIAASVMKYACGRN